MVGNNERKEVVEYELFKNKWKRYLGMSCNCSTFLDFGKDISDYRRSDFRHSCRYDCHTDLEEKRQCAGGNQVDIQNAFADSSGSFGIWYESWGDTANRKTVFADYCMYHRHIFNFGMGTS